MKRPAVAVFVLLMFCAGPLAALEKNFWNLPQQLNDVNTKVVFEVDSTWHLVHGNVSGVTGRVWLDNPGQFDSIRAEIHFPVKLFDTDNSSRDKKMRRVMAEEKYPDVVYKITGVENLSDPDQLGSGDSRDVALRGNITIRDVTLPISAEARVSRMGDKIQVAGKAWLDWSNFGVDDPSILIARLHKKVDISFTVTL